MKSNFIYSLVSYFIQREYFNLILAENGQMDFNHEPANLIKNMQGTSVMLRIIDADSYSEEHITGIMHNSAAMLNNLEGRDATIFMLFLFNARADEQKAGIIESGQLDIVSERKFLKCFSINLNERQIQKHFSVPAFDAGIIKTVKNFLSKRLDDRETTVDDILRVIEQRNKDYEILLKAKTPWLTYGLIGANVLVWLLLQFLSMKSGTAYENLLEPFGAKSNALILSGQFWRFFTPMFLHAGIIHLALNCYSLYIVGTQVEKLFGHGRFAAIYFIAGFLGNVASFAFSSHNAVGASGAIFGLMGAMLYFAVKRPSLLKSSFGTNLITTLVINLAYGYMNTSIDNYGHLGGLVGGYITTGIVYLNKEETRKDKLHKMLWILTLIIVTTGVLLYGFGNTLNTTVLKYESLKTYDSQQNWSEAEKTAEEIIALNPSDKYLKTQTLWSLTRAEAAQQKYAEGIQHAALLKEIDTESGSYLLGVIYYYDGQFQKAKQELEAAKAAGSSYNDSINTLLEDISSRVAK